MTALSDKALESSLRALAEALESGIGVATYLDNPAASAMLPAEVREGLQRSVGAGGTLATGFGLLGVMTSGELALLRAGEKRGHVVESLRALADAIEQRRKDRHRLLMGLLYPALLLSASGCLLPLPLLVKEGLGAYLSVAVWLPLLVLLGVIYALVVVPRLGPTSPLRVMPRRIGFSLPFLGGALRKGAYGTFLEVLGGCLSAGLPLWDALKSAIIAADEPRLLAREASVLGTIEAGGTLGEALTSAGVFDPSVLAAVGQGELTGKLDEVLPRTARAQRAVARQAVMIVIGVLVFVVAVAVLGMIVTGLVQGVQGYFETLDGVLDKSSR